MVDARNRDFEVDFYRFKEHWEDPPVDSDGWAKLWSEACNLAEKHDWRSRPKVFHSIVGYVDGLEEMVKRRSEANEHRNAF